MLHGIAFAERHRVVLHGFVIDGDPERGADLVLPAVAPADGAGLVVGDGEMLLQQVADGERLLGLAFLPHEGKDRGFDGRETRVEVDVVLHHASPLVVAAESGAPVADTEMRVSCHVDRRLQRAVLRTDATGRLALSLPEGSYGVYIAESERNGVVPVETSAQVEWRAGALPDRIELGATARVTGNVYYGLIEMEMGAEINGKLIHEPRKAGAARQEPAVGVGGSGPVVDNPS